MMNKDMIGFVGAPWTILVYMINCSSPKNGLIKNFFDDELLIKEIMTIIEKFLKLHIKNQVDAGANIIQIFDSWAGLLDSKIDDYILNPTLNLVEYTKRAIGISPLIKVLDLPGWNHGFLDVKPEETVSILRNHFDGEI